MGRYTCKDVKFLQSNERTSLDALSLCLISLVPIIIGELSYDASAALTHNSSISLMLARNFRLCVGYGMTTVRGLRTISIDKAVTDVTYRIVVSMPATVLFPCNRES